jgi:hypothetical protein
MLEEAVLRLVRATMSVTAGINTAAKPTRIIKTTMSSTNVNAWRFVCGLLKLDFIATSLSW